MYTVLKRALTVRRRLFTVNSIVEGTLLFKFGAIRGLLLWCNAVKMTEMAKCATGVPRTCFRTSGVLTSLSCKLPNTLEPATNTRHRKRDRIIRQNQPLKYILLFGRECSPSCAAPISCYARNTVCVNRINVLLSEITL
jgi:hypothetical protein